MTEIVEQRLGNEYALRKGIYIQYQYFILINFNSFLNNCVAIAKLRIIYGGHRLDRRLHCRLDRRLDRTPDSIDIYIGRVNKV